MCSPADLRCIQCHENSINIHEFNQNNQRLKQPFQFTHACLWIHEYRNISTKFLLFRSLAGIVPPGGARGAGHGPPLPQHAIRRRAAPAAAWRPRAGQGDVLPAELRASEATLRTSQAGQS